jgi:hypothetical protein
MILTSFKSVRAMPERALSWNSSRLIPATVGLLLLSAAGLKTLYPPLSASHLLLFSSPALSVALVELELLMGLWLWSGLWRAACRLAALGLFFTFAVFNLEQTWAGAVSCACFGRIPFSPWAAVCLDLLVVVVLWFWRPAAHASIRTFASHPLRSVAVGGMGVLLAISGAVAMSGSRPAVLTENGAIVGNGGTVVLEPEAWIGKRFPLLTHIDVGAELASGEWLVILYRRDCHSCLQVMAKYEQLAREEARDGKAPRIALVEVPQDGQTNTVFATDESACKLGYLKGERRWYVATPVLLQVENGRVTSCKLPSNR